VLGVLVWVLMAIPLALVVARVETNRFRRHWDYPAYSNSVSNS
jgi:hypothetical protein